MALRRGMVLTGLCGMLVVAVLLSATTGAVSLPVSDVIAALLHRLGFTAAVPDAMTSAVLFDIRLPRIALGLAVGASLGISGAALQAQFRNPLADPGLLGVSSGAASGAVGWIVLGAAAPLWMQTSFSMPLAAFMAALLATVLVHVIAKTRHLGATAGTLLLAGIAVNALGGALVGFFTYLGSETQLRSLTYWMLGGLSGVTWHEILPALPVMVISGIGLTLQARSFDVLALGERDAGHLGIRVKFARRVTISLVALSVGAAVALSGVIGFVGLAAPHLVRLTGGPHHRYVLPGAALMGALIIVVADLLARTLVVPAELPVGILTSALGAPFFIWLLRRGRSL